MRKKARDKNFSLLFFFFFLKMEVFPDSKPCLPKKEESHV